MPLILWPVSFGRVTTTLSNGLTDQEVDLDSKFWNDFFLDLKNLASWRCTVQMYNSQALLVGIKNE